MYLLYMEVQPMSSNKACLFCEGPTNNPKFCSRACAAKINNKTAPKRKKEGKCKICNISIKSSRTYCKECFSTHRLINDITLGQAMYREHHTSSAYALVRARARATDKFKKATCCSFCGYSKHIEACHIKPISKYAPDTLLSEINKEENIIPLCRNCHWELDHAHILYK